MLVLYRARRPLKLRPSKLKTDVHIHAQATGKTVEAVKKLILGPMGSPIEMVMAEGMGGGTRTVRMCRRAHDASAWEACDASEAAPQMSARVSSQASGEGRVRQQIVPSPKSGPLPGAFAAARAQFHARSIRGAPRAEASTQVGLTVAHEADLILHEDDFILGSSGCGLRVKAVLHNCSVGRYERVEPGEHALSLCYCFPCFPCTDTWRWFQGHALRRRC
jgi:hypothetical protein